MRPRTVLRRRAGAAAAASFHHARRRRLLPAGAGPGRHDAADRGDTNAFSERITKLPLAHQPGTPFEYSFSTDVLGAVVEKVTEQRLGEYLQGRVWRPLGMVDTSFVLSDRVRPRLARALPNNPLDGKPQTIPVIEQQMRFDCGGGASLTASRCRTSSTAR